MKDGTTIRIPQQLIERIDEFVQKGYYASRSEFVTAAVRYSLIFYADLRKVAVEGKSTILGAITAQSMPEPINDRINGLDLLLKRKPESNPGPEEKPTEEYIANYYKSVTKVFLEVFDYFGGGMKQVGFAYPDGLRDRARVLQKTAYGFNRKMDYIKASIICLLVKTFESDMLYDEIDRYYSGMEVYYADALQGLMSNFFLDKNLEKIITDVLEDVFDISDDETSEGDGDSL